MKKILLFLALCVFFTKINASDISQYPLGKELYTVLKEDYASFAMLYQTSAGCVSVTLNLLSEFEQTPFAFTEKREFEVLKKNIEIMIAAFSGKQKQFIEDSLTRISGLLLQAKDFKTTFQAEEAIEKLISIAKYGIKQDWEAQTGRRSWDEPDMEIFGR